MLREFEVKRVGEEWSKMSIQQREAVKSKVAELRLKAQSAEPFHVEILETWRTNSESICDEADTWAWPEEFAEGARWAIEGASLERLFSPNVMGWEIAQRRIEAAMLDPAIRASPEVIGMLDDVLCAIDWNACGKPDELSVWHFLVSDESIKAARSQMARSSARAKNAKPREWVVKKWRERPDAGQSKAAFARQHAALVKAKYRIEVTPETIARDWLPKG